MGDLGGDLHSQKDLRMMDIDRNSAEGIRRTAEFSETTHLWRTSFEKSREEMRL
jgi:hypothetical protein